MNAQLHAFDSGTCPRIAAWMAGLSAVTGDRAGAGAWLLELIAWMAFDDARRPNATSQATLAELRC